MTKQEVSPAKLLDSIGMAKVIGQNFLNRLDKKGDSAQ